jgi:hypothetical protein
MSVSPIPNQDTIHSQQTQQANYSQRLGPLRALLATPEEVAISTDLA